MKAIEILQSAQKKKKIEVRFDIPAGDEVIPVLLTAPDIYAIWEEQEKIYEGKLAELVSEGYDKQKPNLKKWKKEIEEQLGRIPKDTPNYQVFVRDRNKQLEKDKPESLAEQLAQRTSRLRTIQSLLPKFLKNPDGSLLFPTQDDQKQFKDILCSDSTLMSLLANKYLELSEKISSVGETVKNG